MIGLLLATLAPAAPLHLDEVLAHLDERVPRLARAQAEVDIADAGLLGARAAFDPTISVSGAVLAGGYPSGRVVASARTRTAAGVDLEAGWRLGQGEFAAYDEKAETLDGGEVFARVELGLREVGLPSAVVATRSARADRAAREADQEALQLALREEATRAYWSWVRAARLLEAEEELLALARSRDEALAAQVAAGTRPAIDRIDNTRILAERRARTANADATLARAALSLSLLYRDPQGAPIRPTRDQVPPPVPPGPPPALAPLLEGLGAHPELVSYDARVERADQQLVGARRGALPDLRLGLAVSQDLGAGRSSLAPTTLGAEISWRGGVLWRGPRAAVGAASARLTDAEARRQDRGDTLDAELRAAAAALEAAVRAWEAAGDGVEAADAVVRAEQRLLELGGSDLVRLVLREESLWSARKALADAEAAAGVARAALERAAGRPAS